MNGLTLYHSATSPYVRKVMVLAHEAGLAERIALVPASGTPLDPGSVPLEANPLGKVPVLTRPEGGALYDSRVICAYLGCLGRGSLLSAGRAALGLPDTWKQRRMAYWMQHSR